MLAADDGAQQQTADEKKELPLRPALLISGILLADAIIFGSTLL